MTRSAKIVGTIAVVGVVAAVAALLGMDSKTSMGHRLLQSNEDAQATAQFQNFINKHNKNYLTKDEYNARLSIFKANLDLVKTHNAANEGFTLGINKFADLSQDEFEKMNGLRAIESSGFLDDEDVDADEVEEQPTTLQALQAPASVDWRTSGAVTAVKNQGSCGSCYTFAAVASLEGLYKIKKGSLVEFSEQQLLDCSSGFGNMGCSGGLMTNCYKYLQTSKQMKRGDYPYIGYKSTCKYNSAKGVFSTSGYVNIPAGNVQAHIDALAAQPIAVAMAASSSVVSLYRSGIISSTACGTGLNHGVTMVGYGSQNGVNYWIVKNSWGTNWGEAGYFRIARSATNGDGICGILKMSSYPKMI